MKIPKKPKKRHPKPKVYQGQRDDQVTNRLLQDRSVSVIMDDFHGVNWHKQTKVFPLFTVYKNPSDFPDKFVARLFDGDKPTRLMVVKDTLEEARETIPPYYYRINRSEQDDPIIVETWI